MSTKIYDIYKTSAPLHVILEALHKMRRQLQSKARAYYLSQYTLTSRIPEEKDLETLHHVALNILTGYRSDNYTCSAAVYGVNLGMKGRASVPWTLVHFLGIENGSEPETREAINAFAGQDYHYQNSCDRPDDVSKHEWRKREKLYDHLFSEDHRVPATAGFTYEIITPEQCITWLIEGFWTKYTPERFRHDKVDPDWRRRCAEWSADHHSLRLPAIKKATILREHVRTELHTPSDHPTESLDSAML